MNYLISTNKPLTMNSGELAELLQMERKEVNRKIRDMFQSEIVGGIISPTFRANGQVDYYMLPEVESTMFVGKWHTPFLRALSEYWVSRKNTTPKLPQTFAEALQLAANQAKQLELAAPKVAFVDNFVETGTTKTLRETAKILNYPERMMISVLIEDKVLYRQSGNLLPYQKYHEQKLFEVKTGERSGYAYTQTRITTRGLAWLSQRYASELIGDK